jgi:ABC-type sugar transport system, periplasmic component
MKKLYAPFAALLVCMLVAVAGDSSAADKIVIGVSTDSGAAVFRTIQMDGLYQAAKAAGNVQIVELNADNDTTTQYQQIKSLVDQGVDCLVVCAIDQDAILTAFDYVQEAGIPLICYDRKIDHPWVSYNVIYNSWSDANQLAEFVLSKNDGKPHKVLLTVGSLADPNGIARRDGFYDVVGSHKNLQVIEVMTEWDIDMCLTNMQNALQLHPDVWTIINVSAHMDGSIMTALDEAGLKKKVGENGHVNFASLSGDPPSLDYLQAGYTDACYIIPADMTGQAVYDAAIKLIGGEKPAEQDFILPTYPVTMETFAKLKDNIWTIKYANLLK